MGNSWNIPGFDVYDPSLVFYAPLWRPDMVARGGSIKNGTGTMDVNPQALAVGANTITVTAAGTLIVAMPEGGTVASGTMTVTGSPVTVSAGIQTTITTTGAIGNITCTPSNIIRSKDRNNHALTVTGATWGYQGRTFVAASAHRIQVGVASDSALQFTGDTTIIVWAKPTSFTTESRSVIAKSNNAGIDRFNIGFTTTPGFWCYYEANDVAIFNSNTGSPVSDTWYFMVLRYGSGGAKFDVDLVNQASDASTAKMLSGTHKPLYLGRDYNDDFEFQGTEGEAWGFNRYLTDVELSNMRNVTKWRFN